MGREVRRVAVDFDWPRNKVWQGFLMPGDLREDECDTCGGNGLSPYASRLYAQWYGNAPFRPEDNDSIPLTPEHPTVRAFAERNVAHAPEFYGTGEWAIYREAQRLADLWNESWSHHLNEQDIADLLATEDGIRDLTHEWVKGEGWRPKDPMIIPTPAEVQTWMIVTPLASLNYYRLIEARCERVGVPFNCGACDGHGSVEAYEGQRADAEAWEPTPPPEGDGWQLWETVSEGSPISPVFPDAEGLIQWMRTPDAKWGASGPWSEENARAFVLGPGWAPTFVGMGAMLVDGVTATTEH